jgi:hypothetical protein
MHTEDELYQSPIVNISLIIIFAYRIFTDEEIEEIRQVRLYDVIVNSTDIKHSELQKHVFFWVKGDPCPQPVQLNISLLEPCKYLQGYDYFEVKRYTLWLYLEQSA